MAHGAGKDGKTLSPRRIARGAGRGRPQAAGGKGRARLHPARMRAPCVCLACSTGPPLRLDRRSPGRDRDPRLPRAHGGDVGRSAPIRRRRGGTTGRPGRRLHGLCRGQPGAVPAHVQPRGQPLRGVGPGPGREVGLPPAPRGGRSRHPPGLGRREGAHGRLRLGLRARLHHPGPGRPARRARICRARSRPAAWRRCRRWSRPSSAPAANPRRRSIRNSSASTLP